MKSHVDPPCERHNGVHVTKDLDVPPAGLSETETMSSIAALLETPDLPPKSPVDKLKRSVTASMRRLSHAAPDIRGKWSNQAEFFLSCLGYAVGLGNVWRFPYLCYKNGGGAFMFPYLIMMLLCALPLMLVEHTMGQFFSSGPLTLWKFCPLFKGVGIGMLVCMGLVCVYYNVIVAWAVYYFAVSLNVRLPWVCCQDDWKRCISFGTDCASNITNASIANVTDIPFSADLYFHRVALAMSPSLHELGNVQWHLALSLFFAWLAVFLVLQQGIKSFGKVVYFTSLFPYLILFVLLGRVVSEPGALNGIRYFVTPVWDRLLDARVWGDALAQVFYSTGVAAGGILTLSSYNKFNNNCYRDTLIVAVADTLTSVLSGFVVFSILGFMAHRQDAKIDDIVTQGPGLTFILYPQAMSLLPWAPLWSAMFFLMLVTIGLSSMFPMVESLSTALIDQFPEVLRRHKRWVTLAFCMGFFLAGLLFTTQAGMYILLLMDKYAVGWALVILGLAELLVFAWKYGTGQIAKAIHLMTGVKISPYVYPVLWKFVCPALLVFTLVFSWVMHGPLTYGSYVFPVWSEGFGWFLSFLAVLPIPFYAIFIITKRVFFNAGQCSPYESLKHLWTPALDSDVEERETECLHFDFKTTNEP